MSCWTMRVNPPLGWVRRAAQSVLEGQVAVMDRREWWTVPVNVAVGVVRGLPAALIGVVMLVTFAGLLGPTWGGLAALAWLTAGVATLTRPGERLVVTAVLRYRRAAHSWLAAEVHRLAPGRRIEVYVAPHAFGVFAVGDHTIAVGQRSIEAATPTSALHAAAVAAVADLLAAKTRPQLAMTWWSAPWLLAKVTMGYLVPARWHPLLRILGCALMGMAVATCLRQGQPIAAALGVCMIADLALAYLARHQLRAAARRTLPTLPQTLPAQGRTRS